MPLIILPIMLIGLPLLEIAGFVLVGRAIGLWPTLGLIVLTSLIGGMLLRIEGMSVLRDADRESREGRLPGKSLVSGAMIVVAGILLILPGFLTDIIGLLLFIPPVRQFLWSLIGKKIVVVRSTRGSHGGGTRNGSGPSPKGGEIIDLDEGEFSRGQNPSSPWSDRPGTKD